jgi:hypothetical protein
MFENITDNKFVMDYPYASNYYEVINSNGNNNFTLPMHIEEAKRDERFYKYIHNYGYLDNQKLYPVNYSMIPCNSGVIGLTYNNRELLNDVYSVTKKLWEQYEYIPSEEYAFSYIFNKNGIVSYAYNHILHYHRAKFLRLLVANSLGIFFYDDQLQFKKLLNFFSFDENALSNMSINDIPYFVMYLQEMFGCKIPPVGAVEDINNVQTIRNILKYRNLKINRTFDEFVNFLYEIN